MTKKDFEDYLILISNKEQEDLEMRKSLPKLSEFFKEDLSHIKSDGAYFFDTSDFGRICLNGKAILYMKNEMFK